MKKVRVGVLGAGRGVDIYTNANTAIVSLLQFVTTMMTVSPKTEISLMKILRYIRILMNS